MKYELCRDSEGEYLDPGPNYIIEQLIGDQWVGYDTTDSLKEAQGIVRRDRDRSGGILRIYDAYKEESVEI